MGKTTKKLTERPQDTTRIPARGRHGTASQRHLTMAEKMMIKTEIEAGSTYQSIAQAWNISKSTCYEINRDERLSQRAVEIARIKTTLADDLLLAAGDGVTQVRDKIKDCNARDAAIVTGVMIDKSRLMSGQTTQNVGVAGLMAIIHSNEVSAEGLHFNPDKPKQSK